MKVKGDVIIKPIITEHSLKDAKNNRYTFLVNNYATKTDIKSSVEKLFTVTVKKVFTSKIKRTETIRNRASRKSREVTLKKARVLLGKDQKIDLFDEVAE